MKHTHHKLHKRIIALGFVAFNAGGKFNHDVPLEVVGYSL
jgi:hypothetical protein